MAKEFFTAEWFPYYHERFERSDKVALMNCTVEGAYHRAIRWVWKERSMSADAAVFASRFKCSESVANKVLATFIPDPGDAKRVIHPVVEEIRVEQEEKFLTKRKGGKAAAEKRKLNAANKDTSSTTQLCSNTNTTRTENREQDSSNEESKIVSVGEPPGPSPPIREMFTGTVTAELEKRLDVKSLPSKLEWQRSADWAFENGFTSDQFLECHELLKKQRWRDGPVKPKHICENLPNLQKLRDEIAKQSTASGKLRPAGKTTESSAEVIKRLGVS